MSGDVHEFLVSGLRVQFPHEKPYPAQMAIMAGTVRALRNGDNAILESPTGTGKSLALLAASIAYQKSLYDSNSDMSSILDPPLPRKYLGFFPPYRLQQPGVPVFSDFLMEGLDHSKKLFYAPEVETADDEIREFQELEVTSRSKRKVPQIWYATRTHQQLKQLVKEIKQINYRPQMCILASRKHACIWKKALQSDSVDSVCYDSMATKACPYKITSSIPREFKPGGVHEKFELSDLLDYCRIKKLCPYSISRAMMRVADVVFCPYNFFMDPKVKGQMQLEINGVFLIIDEAHNIDGGCRENGTFVHTRSAYNWSIMYLRKQNKKWEEPGMVKNAILIVLNHIQKIYNWFTSKADELRDRKIDKYIAPDTAAVLDAWALNPSSWPRLEAAFDCLFKFSNVINMPSFFEGAEKISMKLTGMLEELWVMFALVFKNGMENVNDYKIYIKPDINPDNDTLHGLVMNPGIVFDKPATEAHSVILSSGTLSPLSTFAQELRKPFKVLLSAPHVIDKDQVAGYTISMLPDGTVMNSTARHLSSNREFVNKGLARVLITLLPVIPGGVLLFVPSHSFLTQLVETWKQMGLYNEIDCIKKIFVESREVSDDKIFSTYKQEIDENGGAILLSVFRGRASEGIDFVDDQARCVIAFGIPYPSIGEPDVFLKRQYNESIEKGSGDVWYEAQAFRSLFQAIGRCIRHRNDYGSIILIDDRFEKELTRFPRWMTPSIKTKVPLNGIRNELSSFYGAMTRRFPSKETIKIGQSLTLCCEQCARVVIDIQNADSSNTFTSSKKGFMSLVHAMEGDPIYPIKSGVQRTDNFDLEEEIFIEKDQYVYQKIRCHCGACLGAKVVAAKKSELSNVEALWIVLSRVLAKKNQNLVPINPNIGKKKGTMLLAKAEGGQSQIRFE